MARYRIGSRGASHTRLEGKEWKRYGRNDVIELDAASVDAGLYDHLKLTQVSGDVAISSSPATQVPTQNDKPQNDDAAAKLAIENAAIERNAEINNLILEAEQATSGKDVAAVVAKVKEANLLSEPPAKKTELIEALNGLLVVADK